MVRRRVFVLALLTAGLFGAVAPTSSPVGIRVAHADAPACTTGYENTLQVGYYSNPPYYTGSQPEHFNGTSVNFRTPYAPVVCGTNQGSGNFSSAWDMLVGNDYKHYMQAGIFNVYNRVNCDYTTWGQSNLNSGAQDWYGPCITPGDSHHMYVETYSCSTAPSGQCGRIVADGNVIFYTTFDPFSYIAAPAYVQFAEETHFRDTRVPGSAALETDFQHLQVETTGHVWNDACNNVNLGRGSAGSPPSFYNIGALDQCVDHLGGWDSRA